MPFMLKLQEVILLVTVIYPDPLELAVIFIVGINIKIKKLFYIPLSSLCSEFISDFNVNFVKEATLFMA